MTLTIDLPDSLSRQCRERRIPDDEIKAVIVAALEVWLAQESSENSGPFAESAVPFVKRLITRNRELFEALAQR